MLMCPPTVRFDMYDSNLKRYYVVQPKRGADVRKHKESVSTKSQELAAGQLSFASLSSN